VSSERQRSTRKKGVRGEQNRGKTDRSIVPADCGKRVWKEEKNKRLLTNKREVRCWETLGEPVRRGGGRGGGRSGGDREEENGLAMRLRHSTRKGGEIDVGVRGMGVGAFRGLKERGTNPTKVAEREKKGGG